MAFVESRQQTFPTVPPSLSAGDHEMRDYYGDSSAPRPSPSRDPYLTPYLGLRARLSQIWINQWTVLLILVLVRVLLSIDSSNDLINDARSEALSACTSVEKVGSAFASMPHYMSQGVNSMTASGITKAVGGLQTMVQLSLTGVEEMVIFWIGMLTNTYLCLLTLAVSGSLGLAVDTLSKAQDDMNKALNTIGDDISSVASGIQNGINSLVSGINTVIGKDPPKIDFTSQINSLKTLQLPKELNAQLTKVNASIPTFDDVKNFTNGVISIPFNDLKTLINKQWGNYTFNQSLFPVPAKKDVAFCSGNNHINNFFDNLKKMASTAKKVFIVVLTLAAILACIPAALLEYRKYKRQQARSKTIGRDATDSMDAVYLASRPWSSDLGRKLAGRFASARRQTLVRWCIAYATSLPALLLISLALAGFFSCFCQWILLRIFSKQVPALTAEIVGFADDVVQAMNNASSSWATDANAVLLRESDSINKDLLSWVNTSTVAVNNTLNAFVDQTIGVLNTTLGGTPLYGPVKGVFDCLIGLKVKGIASGLTWVHDNAQIKFPMLPNDTMTIGALLQKTNSGGADFFNDPKGTTEDDVTRALTKVTNKILKSIQQEALISFMLLLAWFIIFIIGFIAMFIRHRNQGRSGSPTPFNFNNDYQPDEKNVYGRAQAFEPRNVTTSPAPAYFRGDPDVSNNAPYSLNPHPFRRSRSSSEDELEEQKHGISRDTIFPTTNQYRAEPVNYNEKRSFI
jgi:hypothetical protein